MQLFIFTSKNLISSFSESFSFSCDNNCSSSPFILSILFSVNVFSAFKRMIVSKLLSGRNVSKISLTSFGLFSMWDKFRQNLLRHDFIQTKWVKTKQNLKLNNASSKTTQKCQQFKNKSKLTSNHIDLSTIFHKIFPSLIWSHL